MFAALTTSKWAEQRVENEKPKTFIASEKKEIRIIIIAF